MHARRPLLLVCSSGDGSEVSCFAVSARRDMQKFVKTPNGQSRLNELQEQLDLARLATTFTVDPDIAKSYSQLCDSFSAMAQSKCIWDTLTRKATNRVAERTAASESITRE